MSAPSYELVDYRFRPAKAVERKMMCEALRRLSAFGPLDSYRYIGFGSVFFSDFLLIHRSLGLTRMVSIERDKSRERRFRFNRPFAAIRCLFKESTAALPTLGWKHRSIVWLDYDTTYSPNMATDIETVCANAPSGSVLIVTVDARPRSKTTPDQWTDELALLRSEFASRLPLDIVVGGKRRSVTPSTLASGGLARVYATMIHAAAEGTCRSRAAGQTPERRVSFQKLFDFEYADGARMLTVGGLIFEARHQGNLDACRFDNIPFLVRSGDADP